MKTLYIVRHAKAVDRSGDTPDFDRPLSARGRRDAHAMAEHTRDHGPRPDQLISSPAPRAFETAHAFAQVYHYPVAQIRTYPSLYQDMGLDAFLSLVQHLDDSSQTAMICGHAPLCGDIVNALAPTAHVDMTVGAVACLQFYVSSWAEVAPGRGLAIWSHDPTRKPSNDALPPSVDPLQAPAAIILQPIFPFDSHRLTNAFQQGAYTVAPGEKTQQSITYLDTFDWRLYNRSLTLQWQSPTLSLQTLSSGAQPRTEVVNAVPDFATDLPLESGLRQHLAPITGIRALMPRFACTAHEKTWRVLNPDDKTIARLVVASYTFGSAPPQTQPPLPALTHVRLKPLKGYAKEAKDVQTCLMSHGLIPSQTPLYVQGLAVLGITPNDYRAKPQFQLVPTMRGDAAMRSILRFLFTVMRQNEAGILGDIDTEFLHDFRVASRRARSAVGQIKGVFSASVRQRLKQDLASLGAMTNRVRDLDVYLLKQANFRKKLPDHLQAAMEPLFDLLRQDRKQAFRSLTRKMRAKSYAGLMARWETFLALDCPEPEAELATAPNASRPILKIARKRLSKTASRVVEAGHLLLAHMDDARMHELRIDCKKLRYLLEFFASLFPPSAIDPVIKRLRKLQDDLGDFNDCCVQQQTLEAYAERFAEDSETRLAIAHLIDVLEADKQAFKAAFPGHFKPFAASVSGSARPWKTRSAKDD